MLGKYIISDTPMSEEQWAKERADVIDDTFVEDPPKSSQDLPKAPLIIRKPNKT